MRSRLLVILTLGASMFCFSLLTGVLAESCKSSEAMPDAGIDPYGNPCQDGTYQLLNCLVGPDGGPPIEHFSDEACINLDQAEMRGPIMQNNSIAPTITAPTQGQVLPGATPFVFMWSAGNVALRRVPPSFRAITLADEWARWTTLIPEADAHCPPYSGLGYAAVFLSQGQEVLRAETEFLMYTPTMNAWQMLQGATPPISMYVEVAQFDTSALTAGPWEQTAPVTFSIGQ